MKNNFKFGDIIIHQEKGRGVVVATFLNSIDVVFDGDRKIKTLSLKCEKVTLEHQDKWISVTDKLPEKDGEYIVAIKDGRKISISSKPYKKEKGFLRYMASMKEVITHWQPLPEPPKCK